MQIRDEGNYALSSRRQSEPSSYITRDTESAQAAPSAAAYSPRERDPLPVATRADDLYHGRAPQASDYPRTSAYNPTYQTLSYVPEALEAVQPEHPRPQFYPSTEGFSPTQTPYALPAYQYQQQSTATADDRQQNNLPPRANPKAQQKLDASFFIRKHDYKKFFRVGKVFMTLWSEQFGSGAEQGSFVSDVIYGERVYSKVRRFLVVREGADKRSATCLPITSYSGSGLGKNGIELGEHGFIYSKEEPKHVAGMCSKSLKVNLSPKAPDLAHPSLVNYGKVHNVEGNWKVKDIGDLDGDSRKALLRYFRRIFRLEDDGLPEPEMTPRAKYAALAHVGAGLSSHPTVPARETYPASTTATAQQNFTSISPTEGYPLSTTYESGRDAPFQYPPSTQESPYPTTYSATSYATSTQGKSYQGYEVAMATGRAVSSPASNPVARTNAAYYNQYNSPNAQSGGSSAYPNYDNRQSQQSWPAPLANFIPGDRDGYTYPNTQYASQATSGPPYQGEGTMNTVYAHRSGYEEPAIAQSAAEADIRLPSLAEAEADSQRERKRRDSKASEGSKSSHRKRQDRGDHRRR